MLVDLETLPMTLRVGVKLDSDLSITGHPPKSLHFDKLKAVKFSNRLVSNGLSCLPMSYDQSRRITDKSVVFP